MISGYLPHRSSTFWLTAAFGGRSSGASTTSCADQISKSAAARDAGRPPIITLAQVLSNPYLSPGRVSTADDVHLHRDLFAAVAPCETYQGSNPIEAIEAAAYLQRPPKPRSPRRSRQRLGLPLPLGSEDTSDVAAASVAPAGVTSHSYDVRAGTSI